jgi:iron complex outermembrane receptor protein
MTTSIYPRRVSAGQRRGALRLACSATALALAAPAAAQTIMASAAAQAATDGVQIEEVVVSARRRKETIQETPVAVTSVSAAQMEAVGATEISDLHGAVPNLLFTPAVSGFQTANVSIRGLSFADNEKSFDPSVALVVDGVFQGSNTAQLMDNFDLASIEVLRGPQGTLFGRNTIGGVINVTRTRPTGAWGAKLGVDYGRFDTFSARAVVNVPLVEDKLAAKFFYFHTQTDGFQKQGARAIGFEGHVSDVGDRRGGSNSENYGLALLFTPTEDFSALLTLEQQSSRFDQANANICKTGELLCDLEPLNERNRNSTSDLYTVFSGKFPAHGRTPAATLELNADVGGVHLVSVTGYRRVFERQRTDFSGSSLNFYVTDRKQRFYQFSEELRASGNITSDLDYVVGGYYYNGEYQLTQYTTFAGVENPEPQITRGQSETAAVFGDFNWAFADKWRLSFGGRYSWDKKTNQTRYLGLQFPKASVSSNEFTPKIGVDFRPNDDVMFYGVFSRGYRSGGFSGRGLSEFAATTPFQPETVDSFEGGLKTSWFDRRLDLNLAAFHTKYDNIQQSTTIPFAGGQGNQTIITNASSAEINGIEVDLTARPVPALTIRASLGLLDAKFGKFLTQEGTPAIYDYSDVDLIYAPDVTASISFEYTIPASYGEWSVSGSYRYIDPYDQQIGRDATVAPPLVNGVFKVPSNDPRVRTKAENLIDASVALVAPMANGKVRISVFGRNLLDERGPAAAFTVAGLWSFANPHEPRTFGVQFGYEF